MTGDPADRAAVVAALAAAGCVFPGAEADELIAQVEPGRLADAVARRAAGEPLEHVVGSAVFAGLRVAVHPPVFVPRRRAEPLSAAAVAEVTAAGARTWGTGPDGRAVGLRGAVAARPGGAVVAVDLGCGSGAIAAVLATRTMAQVYAVDVSPAAVRCARANGARFGFAVGAGDWWAGLPGGLAGAVDVAVAYTPHVPDAELGHLDRDLRRAEQDVAVRGGPDGLDPWRALLADAGAWLAPGGVLLTLVARAQAPAARAAAADAGMNATARPGGAGDAVLTARAGCPGPPGPVPAPRPPAA